jgi:hypothetical protein
MQKYFQQEVTKRHFFVSINLLLAIGILIDPKNEKQRRKL